jgi:hypothetical protein
MRRKQGKQEELFKPTNIEFFYSTPFPFTARKGGTGCFFYHAPLHSAPAVHFFSPLPNRVIYLLHYSHSREVVGVKI